MLPLDEVTAVRGIPVTTVARTLLDLSAVLSERQLERAMHEAEVLGLRDAISLDELVARYPHRRGVRRFKTVLRKGNIGITVVPSELESRFLSFLGHAGLPRPRVNKLLTAGGRTWEVDCLWPEQKLIVELDGHATHATRTGFERDRARDRTLQAAGWRVVRITWRQLHEASAVIAADLSVLLHEEASGSPPSTGSPIPP